MAEVKRYVTPPFRLSFPHVFTPQAPQDGKGDPKYGVSAVWTPAKFTAGDKVKWKAILGALDAESKLRFKKAWKDLPANVKRGIRNGNEKPDMAGYGEGTRFASLTTKMKPGVIDRAKDDDGVFIKLCPENGNDDEIYPGCYCRATISVYSYDNQGKGVAMGLMNLQKVADGERLDSRTDAAEDFDDDIDEAWLDEDEEDTSGDDDDFG